MGRNRKDDGRDSKRCARRVEGGHLKFLTRPLVGQWQRQKTSGTNQQWLVAELGGAVRRAELNGACAKL